MFNDVTSFKVEFAKRLLERYGRMIEKSHITERYVVLGELIRDYAGKAYQDTSSYVLDTKGRQLIYFSMEFLIGRLMTSNLVNLGIYDTVKQGLSELGFDLNEIEELEADAGLGNGGLGRLAACFMDSIASLGYIGHGNCIRYEYGFFKQKIIDRRQIELPDQWLSNENVWEIKKLKHAEEVQFYGRDEIYMKENGKFGHRHVDGIYIRAIPYDVPVVGYQNGVVNSLRLWSAAPSDSNLPKNLSFIDYLTEIRELCHGLYPDDSTESGRKLRLKQQYFLVSSGIKSVVHGHLRHNKSLDNLATSYVFQLNDTHPILAIPELMRVLMDEHDYSWDDAWKIVTKIFAFTNHTVMAEALEKWPTHYIEEIMPRIHSIIQEISRRFDLELKRSEVNYEKASAMRIIKDGQVYMCNLAIHTAFSVNGVAALHTEILKNDTFKYFYEIYPKKFNNKTNGVTHRRWLLNCNHELATLITKKIGPEWIKDFSKIKDLKAFSKDTEVIKEIGLIKRHNKEKLAAYIKKANGIEVDVDSIFDVQIKRLHAYKRQLMNVLHIIYLYQRLKRDLNFKPYPRTFIFGAKAAPSYVFAKKIIELINCISEVVNNDPDTNKYLKVVFIENYGVTLAELIIPAADVSEQISTAGKEASGTGNMKFMMNGALTLGTLDGANVEIHEFVGDEHMFLFGLKVAEVETIKANHDYNPWDLYHQDGEIKLIIDSLLNGPWTRGRSDRFRIVYDELMYRGDEYLVLKDLEAYVTAQERVSDLYRDQKTWNEHALINIASSGFFTSDRTIEEYVRDIWHLKRVD
ncbi:MAG: glycogen/starch/alpha-glucan phosphorylase [Erysipelotrichaceae bacterium]|jgi:starch phosphorylase|nr:glycogen/starch/alpha-glucan phosphorylase [Erysipelotrichaceae bacterium]